MRNPMHWIEFTVPEDYWEAEGDEGAEGGQESDRMQCAVIINGTPHHFDARAVAMDGDLQTFAPGAYPDDADALWGALGGDGAYRTITIADREYALFVSPFSE